jgi:hypothetical protein
MGIPGALQAARDARGRLTLRGETRNPLFDWKDLE